ncbi:MAG: sigma-70 family RNA polymerase sigma factor [Clostridia bacterium]|nr:sigma-70 family RNA polymerase sigma factor [Clostridia bacterium]
MAERPKRRKHKDNPYTLEFIEEKNSYRVSFRDVKGKYRRIEVNKEIYQAFDRFELDDLSELNEFDNHIEHSEIYENNLNERAMDKPLGVDEIVENSIRDEEIRKAISTLSDIQKRRIIKYYFEDKTEYEIAKEENATQQSVHIGLERAKEKLKEILKNFKF